MGGLCRKKGGSRGSTAIRFAVIQLKSASFFKLSTIPGNS